MFKLPKLEYGYDSLEPYIDKETMEIHHGKHHQAYVDKLNKALENHSELQNKEVVELIQDLNLIPEEIRGAVRNHGGGHFNHSFLWTILKKDVQPSGEVLEAINSKFGSFENFKNKFIEVGMARFGSGWVWLVVNQNKELEIVSTSNQDCPISESKNPVLGADVWEHSYYLKWKSNRLGFLQEYFNVINWGKVNEYFKKAKL